MKIITMRSRNPVVVALMVIVAVGALALAFMLGIILLSTLAIAGTLLGAGFLIRNKLTRGSKAIGDRTSVRATLDPAMEVRPDRELLPPPERQTKEK
jgi:uncharacterized membrane protein YciS (DUF1049 family)